MKYLILFGLLIVVCSLSARAEHETQPKVTPENSFFINVPMLCSNTSDIINELRNRYKEEMTFMGTTKNSLNENLVSTVWVNERDQTWTIIQSNKERDVSCVISMGDGYNQFGAMSTLWKPGF